MDKEGFFSILKPVSFIVSFFGIFMAIPFATSIYYGENHFYSFLVPLLICISFSGISFLKVANSEKELNHKGAFLLVALTWCILPIIGSIPFILSGTFENIIDALFESVSGITTTGASVITDIASVDKSILLWRSMLQWLGGLGIIVFAIVIIPFLGAGGANLFKAEIPGPTKDKISERIAETAKILWIIYIALTGLCFLGYYFTGMTGFDNPTPCPNSPSLTGANHRLQAVG